MYRVIGLKLKKYIFGTGVLALEGSTLLKGAVVDPSLNVKSGDNNLF